MKTAKELQTISYVQNKNIYLFSDRELWYRNLYQKPEGAFLAKPMTFIEYNQLMEEHPEYIDMRDFHRSTMVDDQPNYEYLNRTRMPQLGSDITVIKHERYSYTIKHVHDYVECAYVLSGRCHQFLDNHDIWLEPGDFCILSPNTTHCISAASDDAIVFAIVIDKKLFNSAFIQLMNQQNILSDFFSEILYGLSASPYIIFQTEADTFIRDIILNMYYEICDKEEFFNENVVLYFRQLMIALLRKHTQHVLVATPEYNYYDDKIVAILNYIEVHYQNLTLHELAKNFNYNETYLSRIIKQHTQKSFLDLLFETQMKHAKRLLDETNMSINEISHEIGCFDVSHFHKKFKKYYGESPSTYRKNRH